MGYKKLKKTKKKEDLPSFLLQSPEVPDNVSFPPKTTKSVHHLGPIFFGCHEYQPMIHRLNLVHTHELHKTVDSSENILRDAFISNSADSCLTKFPIESFDEEQKKLFTPGKGQVAFFDPYPHKCPGRRRVFVPESPPIIDLGQTESIIEGETSREIPLYCIRRCLDSPAEEYKLIELSDLWEERRVYMSYKERMAHTHFPKQFVTVEIIGPTIPAPIRITKLPSKRRTESQLDLEINTKTKTKKGAKSNNVKTEKAAEGKAEEKQPSIPEVIPLSEQEIVETVKFDAENEEGVEADADTGSQEHGSGHEVTQADEDGGEKDESGMKDEDEGKEVENEATDGEAPADE